MSKKSPIQSANRSTRIWLALAACLLAVGAAHGRDWVDFTVAGCKVEATGVPLTNFPVAVRISTARIQGFRYSDIASTDDLLFSSTESKDPYPFEVETWNPEGESVIWVRLPSVVTNTKFRMSFNLPPNRPANPKSTNVWSAANYRAVWHMNEYDTSATTKTQADSTGLGNKFTYSGSGGVSTTYAKIGKGFSHNPGATSSAQIGSFPNVTDTILMDYDTGCVLSGWTWWQGWTANNAHSMLYLKTSSSGSYHWQLQSRNQYLEVKYGTSSGTKIGTQQVNANWFHWAIRLKKTANNNTGGQFEFFINGTKILTLTKDSKYLKFTGNNAAHITTGYFQVGGTRGRLDEVRFQNGYRSDDWIQAEYDSVNDADFVVAGPLQRGGKMIIMVQ